MMDRDTSQPGGSSWGPLLRRADQATVCFLVTSCFVAILVHWVWATVSGDSLIEIEQAPVITPRFEVRVNHAEWPELTLLPRIGPTLARRIVEHRERHGPFRSVEQLEDVPGIGPKTVRRIQPFVSLK